MGARSVARIYAERVPSPQSPLVNYYAGPEARSWGGGLRECLRGSSFRIKRKKNNLKINRKPRTISIGLTRLRYKPEKMNSHWICLLRNVLPMNRALIFIKPVSTIICVLDEIPFNTNASEF